MSVKNTGENYQHDQKPQYPSIIQAIWLIVLFNLITFAFGIFFSVAKLGFKGPIFVTIISAVSYGLVLFYGFRKTGLEFIEVFQLRIFPISLMYSLVLFIAGISILLSEVNNVVAFIFGPPRFYIGWMREYMEESISISILYMVIIGPVCEELLFRGLILRGFLQRYSTRKAILVSALLFSLYHLYPYQFIPAFVTGLIFAWLYLRTESLLSCIVGHILFNALAIIAFISIFGIAGFSHQDAGVRFQPLWFDMLGIVATVAGIVLLKRWIARHGH